jgi:hypothetical protein
MKKAYVAVLMLGLLLGMAIPSIINASPMMNRCPNIHHAIDAIKAAQRELAGAKHDFCGKKHDAQEALDNAISKLRDAENCADCK